MLAYFVSIVGVEREIRILVAGGTGKGDDVEAWVGTCQGVSAAYYFFSEKVKRWKAEKLKKNKASFFHLFTFLGFRFFVYLCTPNQ